MAQFTIGDAIQAAWDTGRIEAIAAVCDGLRFQHGLNYEQTHSLFCKVLGREIPLADFDAILFAADEGYEGPITDLGKGWVRA